MAFILPDNILETLVCSFCHKYLSVKPTKVYPNRLIQCGRCVDKTEQEQSIHNFQAVESQYGKIAENILFKCINRFDGCRELLTYSQVRDHEQVCLEKIHKCPICDEEMASFLMLRHFHSKHKDAILEHTAFVFNLNDHLEMPSVYIYQEDDNLFFLHISCKSEKTIKLALVYVGCHTLAKNIYHQFSVSNAIKKFDIVLNPKPCCTDDFVVVDISHNMSNLIQIKFKLIDSNLKVLKSPAISKVVRKPILKKPESISKNASDGNIIEKYRKELNLKCNVCQAYCIFSMSKHPIKTYYIDEQNNYIRCYYCAQGLQYFGILLYRLSQRQFSSEIIDNMNSFKRNCHNCGSEIEFSDMQSHKCKWGNYLMRTFICPIKGCGKIGTVNEMIEHLKDIHKCMAFWSHFKLPTNFSSCYVFTNRHIVFLNVPDVLKHNDKHTRIDHTSIHVELITKFYSSENRPYALFFNDKNEILRNDSKFASYTEVFVKVVVDEVNCLYMFCGK
uniref:Uncharacterized protein LOC114344481 n=1 Tax=Diabrotica virgifera virgifera TaxID=50390 RepID=A0A6P7GYC0_DIAVI